MSKAKTPEGRLRVGCILRARQGGFSAQWVRDLAHDMFGVPSTEDLCLTVLDRGQLIRLRRRIGQILGDPPGDRRPGDPERRPRGFRRSGEPTVPGVIPIASVATLRMIEGLRQELHLDDDEMEGIVHRATSGRTCRALTARDARVTIEALLAIRERRGRQAAAGE